MEKSDESIVSGTGRTEENEKERFAMRFSNFQKGINLGGYLSQYDCIPEPPVTEQEMERHFASFITEEDIKRIAALGFDHVRVPVSGYLLWDREAGEMREKPLFLLDRCISWCETYHLSVIVDLHDIWGNKYGAMDEPMPLLTDPTLQEIFLSFWRKLSEHFQGQMEERMLFELLNEVSDAEGTLWNSLVGRALKEIRKIDKKRGILVGSNNQNSVMYLGQLELLDDPYVVYNFHYYEPLVFTHQKAHFSEELKEFNQTVAYPGDISGFASYLEKNPKWKDKYALTANETRNDHALMEKLLQEAVDFAEKSDCQLYCGEFGVIDTAPPEEAVKWLSDVIDFLDAHGIGHALWNYKSLDFGLVDVNGRTVSGVMLEFIKGKNKTGC